MSPFAALGLAEDADERAVKRAYAVRLKSTRPEDDAEGFQALNEQYKAALAAIRWRAQAEAYDADNDAQDDAEVRPLSEVAENIQLTTDADAAPPLQPEPELHTTDASPEVLQEPDALFAYASERDDGNVEFDFDAFSTDLIATANDPAVDFSAWLQGRMAEWPLSLKPTLAPHVLGALDDESVAVSPEHFAVIIAAFGLDDVLSGADPVAVQQLRAANQQRWTRHEGGARGRRLLAPENRRELGRAMWPAGYPPPLTRALARMVTSPRAVGWTMALRWVPPMARLVMKMLRHISAGAVDALAPPLDPRALAKWQSSERILGRIKIRYVIAFGLLAHMVGGLLWVFVSGDSPEEIASKRVSAIWEEEGPTPERAVADYTAFIASYPPPRYEKIDDDVATAMFNRSIVLGKQLGRTAEAERGYQQLDEAFANSSIASVRLLVAKGLNNWASLLAKRDAYSAVIPVTRRLVARYQGAGDESQGNDSFDVQVAKGLINQANAFEHLGEREPTLATCADLLTRFKNAKSEDMKQLLATARDIQHDYSPGPLPQIGPETPFSLDQIGK